MKFFTLFIGIVFLIISKDSTVLGQEVNAITYEDATVNNFSLDYLADEISYIKLETQLPIKSITNVIINDDRIYIASPQQPLLVFDNKGTFLNKIGNIGKGPGEYLYCKSFVVSNEGEVTILCGKKIIRYNAEGDFKNSLYVNHDDYFSSINRFGRGYVLTNANTNGEAKCNWVLLNEKCQITDEKKNGVKFKTSFKAALINAEITYVYDNRLFYFEQFNDTIFEVKQDGAKINYLINYGCHKYSPEVHEEHFSQIMKKGKVTDPKEYFHIQNIIESHKYLFFNYRGEMQQMKIALYEKSSNSLTIMDSEAGKCGFNNNLDGGISFIPKFYHKKDNIEFLVDWFFPYQLKAFVDTESFMNDTPRHPETKKDLEHFSHSLNENDNPVLRLVKLKN